MVVIGTMLPKLEFFSGLIMIGTALQLDKISCMLQSKHVPDLKIRQRLKTRPSARIGIIMLVVSYRNYDSLRFAEIPKQI
jgi:hypothetical protein